MTNHNSTALPTPHIAEVPAGEAHFQEPLDIARINLNLGHLVQTGEFPENATYAAMKEQAHNSTHDALTGLLNRRGLELAYERRMKANENNPEARDVLIFLDLDGFKEINDSEGHKAGDDLLREVSTEWANSIHLRKGDILARLGGDEFVLIGGTEQSGNKQRKNLTFEQAAEGMVDHAQREAIQGGLTLGMNIRGASAGYTAIKPGMTLEEAKAKADENMYHNKAVRRMLYTVKGEVIEKLKEAA
jgi:diguanylate cyclase